MLLDFTNVSLASDSSRPGDVCNMELWETCIVHLLRNSMTHNIAAAASFDTCATVASIHLNV